MKTIADYPTLTRLLTPLSDPVRAVQMQAYMKNRFPFLGIPKPRLTTALKPHLKAAAREGVDWQTITRLSAGHCVITAKRIPNGCGNILKAAVKK